ncbi:Redox-sensitive bicupin YhaK, pirin superfamily [Pseudoxanthomonas sp. GM95]|uniref:pirin family protein n=1 Tax=Pseudoxanthomonas sp. GM95 TaxID=1881043 RepID=UPI0008B2A8D0|nr:pirin family protein [Pseudoxanthomonas sp. GM95]SEL57388.1 Redox-sensitive bicupin YhaK, pirin superfamily [Pseudoxanthomonas sp. GM95]
MLKDHAHSGDASRAVIQRTRGERHGPLTRLISPNGLGRTLKPFVLLDVFQKDGAASRFGLHPHSGIATVTYVAEGTANYTDPSGESGILADGSLEWMKAGRGMWHAGGSEAGALIGIQLWVALPPALELTPYESAYIAADQIDSDGPARVLLGTSGTVGSRIDVDLPVNYFAVSLAAGSSWSYRAPAGHRVLWLAVVKGHLVSPEVAHGELVVFDETDAPVMLTTNVDTIFVIGSAEPHEHDLVMGRYSIHTSGEALAAGERQIEELAVQLRASGRL